MLARTINVAGANATAGDTETVIISPAPARSVAVTIRIPNKQARSFIVFTVMEPRRAALSGPSATAKRGPLADPAAL